MNNSKTNSGGKNAIIGSIFKQLFETVNTIDLYHSALSCSVSWTNLYFLPMKVTGKIAAVHCVSSSIESSHSKMIFFRILDYFQCPLNKIGLLNRKDVFFFFHVILISTLFKWKCQILNLVKDKAGFILMLFNSCWNKWRWRKLNRRGQREKSTGFIWCPLLVASSCPTPASTVTVLSCTCHSRAERAEFTPQPIQSLTSVLQLQHRCSLKCVMLVSFFYFLFFFLWTSVHSKLCWVLVNRLHFFFCVGFINQNFCTSLGCVMVSNF